MNCIKDGKLTGASCAGCEVYESGCDLYSIVKAVKEDRLRILAEPQKGTCGSCQNFRPEPGMRSGGCAVREYAKDWYGKEYTDRKFVAWRDKKACKAYRPATDVEAGDGRSGGDSHR
jgi:hypothetical protein